MKLDRNRNENGRGKYALLRLRNLAAYDSSGGSPFEPNPVADAISLLDKEGLIDWGEPETEREFFVIRLRDQYAAVALRAYEEAVAIVGDGEYAEDVSALARRAGPHSPFCKEPD